MLKIDKLAIIGVGLIGGSFAMALRKAGCVGEITGCGRSLGNLQKACELGVIDHYTQDVAEAVKDADLVFVAVPLGAFQGVFEKMHGHLKPDAVVTDGGSAKASVVADWQQVFGHANGAFVPGHPVAGTENSGVEAAFDSLYQNRRVILTPMAESSTQAVSTVQALWETAGADVTLMTIEHHDEVLAATSHLPHMLAFGLVDTLAEMEEHTEIFRYAAGGFRDFTRIASSNPEMWRDICLSNADALETVLKRFSHKLDELASMVKNRESEALLELFLRAKQSRDDFVDGVSGGSLPDE